MIWTLQPAEITHTVTQPVFDTHFLSKMSQTWGLLNKNPTPGFFDTWHLRWGRTWHGPQLRRGISEAAAAAGAALADSDVSVSNAALQAMKVSSSWLLGNISNLVNPCKDQQSLYAILLCLHAARLLVCVTHMICWQHWYFANSGASENVPAWRPSAWRNLVPGQQLRPGWPRWGISS